MVKHKYAFTLVEVVITIGLLAVLALGALSYQFHAIKQVKRAGSKMSATRCAMLILENWKIEGGSENYDPANLDPSISRVSNSDKYVVVINDIYYYLELTASDVQSNDETGVTLRELAVSVQWNPNYNEGLPGSDAPISTFNTFVRCDQAGG